MPRIQETVRLRPEVAAGSMHGIISLYALLDRDRNAFECQAERVLQATFPSIPLKRLLSRLQVSLSSQDTDRKGNFVISGGYGSGKSHLLLTIYHLLAAPACARVWLEANEISFDPPQDAVVALMPMTNLTQPGSDAPVEYLWTPIFDALGYSKFHHTGSNFPTVTDLRKAVAKRKVFLIIDEIERWFMPIRDTHQSEANLSFLQNLTEFARDPNNGLFVLVTLLMLEPRIGNIIGRDEAFFEDLTQAPDRRQVVLHRLVEQVNRPAAEEVVDAYLDVYRPLDSYLHIGDYNQYRQQMLECYPFHPRTIEVVFGRYSSVARKEETSYQNSRGALYLLAHVLQETLPSVSGRNGQLQNRDLLLPGDISLTIDRLTDDLVNLEPRLVDIARDNVARSVEQGVSCAAPILSTVLLHSLGDPRAERRLGAEFGDILLGTLRPEHGASEPVTANGVQMAMQQLEGTALNLHYEPHPPRWVFRAEVNVMAQIARRARQVDPAKVRSRLVQTLKKIVGGTVCVYPDDEIPDQRELILVLTLVRLESEQILAKLYYGRAYPNALIIVDPRDLASVAEDPDLVSIASRIEAAEALLFDLVGNQEAQQRVKDALEGPSGLRQALHDRLRDRYGAWRAPISDPDTGDLTFTRVQVVLERIAIYREVEQRYDSAHFRRNVMEAVESRTTPPTVADVRAEFLRQRSFAKPVWQGRYSDVPVDQAICDLVTEAQLEVIRGGDAHYTCGSDPGDLQPQWTVAVPPEEHKPGRYPPVPLPVPVPGPQGPQGPLGGGSGHGDGPWVPPPGPELLTIGPSPLSQVKTDVVRQLNKTDRLSQVTVSYRAATLHGESLATHRDLVGLGSAAPGDAVLDLSWTISRMQVVNRDGLLALLALLPHPSESDVRITLYREKAAASEA